MALGTISATPDGRTYRYSRANSSVDLVAAQAQAAPTTIGATHTNLAVGAAAAVDALEVTNITIGATALTADQYRDGYLTVQDNAGEGFTYQINGHSAYDSTATTVKISLRDPLEIALTTASEVTLAYNPWDLVVVSATDQADLPTGITHRAVDVSVARYYWSQTGGIAAVVSDEDNAVGTQLTTGTGTAGHLEAVDAVAEHVVAHAYELGVAGEEQLAFLVLD